MLRKLPLLLEAIAMRHTRIRFHLALKAVTFLSCSGLLWADQTLQNSMSDQPLLSACKTFSENAADLTGLPCQTYIRGYLAGAWSILNITTSDSEETRQQQPSTLTDRAYQSRVGSRPDLSSSASRRLYCGPADESEKRVLQMLSRNELAQIGSIPDLNRRIDNAIKAVCPSDK